jgi:hypothetical protein
LRLGTSQYSSLSEQHVAFNTHDGLHEQSLNGDSCPHASLQENLDGFTQTQAEMEGSTHVQVTRSAL